MASITSPRSFLVGLVAGATVVGFDPLGRSSVTVAEAGWQAGYGNVVVIDHGFGLKTKYAHASRLLVRAGERVQRGQRVALVGSTGLSTGPHLHYEVHANGRPVDPLRYVLSGSAIVD